MVIVIREPTVRSGSKETHKAIDPQISDTNVSDKLDCLKERFWQVPIRDSLNVFGNVRQGGYDRSSVSRAPAVAQADIFSRVSCFSYA
jgi:hypothetical protein